MNANSGEGARATLRTISARIELELSQLPLGSDGKEIGTALRASWLEMVGALALGTAPETRICPTCQTVGMRAASRCGACWTALAALPPISSNVEA